MEKRNQTTEYLLGQCARYPALEPQDLLKALHQSVFGCGHFVTERASELLARELETLNPGAAADAEPLDGDFCRLHLGCLRESGLAPETLLRLFRLSAETPCGSELELLEKLGVLLELARDRQLPFSEQEISAATTTWKQAGFPACHHSQAFRASYRPAYRVIRRELAWCLPLLAAIDRKMRKQGHAIVAIEGGSASGKTTLAALLERIYDCRVFHVDDFFLRPEQRTAARLAEPGGNMDRERFSEEVLTPLTQGRPIAYRRYDCRTQTVLDAVEIRPKALNIVEGAYSMHPQLAERYDLSVFLRISPQLQRLRIEKRNTPDMAERFFSQWIPLEQTYFETTDAAKRCDLILEVTE